MNANAADFEIRDLSVVVAGKPILKGVSLRINRGEVHALMGPNGSGKSTLSHVIMGHPGYEVTGGDILFQGRSLLGVPVEQRARLGLFLAFQYPVALPGVTVARFLKSAMDALRGAGAVKTSDFLKELRENMAFLEMDPAFLNRFLNDGFSGGEKKRMEILQMMTLKPRVAILDETDSGLDIDAMKIVAKGVNKLVGPELGLLVITHYERLLNYIRPDHLHVLLEGKIVLSGGPELVNELETKGYDWVRERFGKEVLPTQPG